MSEELASRVEENHYILPPTERRINPFIITMCEDIDKGNIIDSKYLTINVIFYILRVFRTFKYCT